MKKKIANFLNKYADDSLDDANIVDGKVSLKKVVKMIWDYWMIGGPTSKKH